MLSPRIHHDGNLHRNNKLSRDEPRPTLSSPPSLSLSPLSLSLSPLSFFFLFHSSSPSGRSQVYFSVRCARSREIATAAEASLLISNCRGPRGGGGKGEVVEEGRVSRILALFSSQRRGKSLLCRESVSSPTATPSCPPATEPLSQCLSSLSSSFLPLLPPFPRRVNRGREQSGTSVLEQRGRG